MQVQERNGSRIVVVLIVVLMIVLFGSVIWFHATMRVPEESEIVVGARLYHYNWLRSKEYMGMDVVSVDEDGMVELEGAGFLGWMAGTERVHIVELTDGHLSMLRWEWVIR
jgi:hypothetical protein